MPVDEVMISSLDNDPAETQEWLEALDSVLAFESPERAQFLIDKLLAHAKQAGVPVAAGTTTPYVNTISPEQEEQLPEGSREHIHRLLDYIRWNAICMVMRAGRRNSSLGGHIASYGSIAFLYEIGFHYFFHAQTKDHGGDLVFFQGHSSPGNYARAFLEGRLEEAHLDGFRQEIAGKGLSSYPHPWLMPDFWQFPTVSMGLGPLKGIYQAHYLRYLHHRGLAKTEGRRVWVFCGDGEMGEVESLGALNLAGREKLDNLTFVINCNLQRLDGPVWGNGQIIQEYESVFRGAGWHVIKVIWGSGWDDLFKRDTKGVLMQRISELVDGEYQNYSAKDGAYMREHFFGKNPDLRALVQHLSDEALKSELLDGGLDPQKVYAAYAAAVKHKGQPTVILAKTIKGYGMGSAGEGLNVTHQTKKMDDDHLKQFCQRFGIPLSESDIQSLTFCKPKEDSPEMQYLQDRRKALGGYLPARHVSSESLKTPELEAFRVQLEDSGDREFSTTMAFVRVLSVLLKDKNIKERIVPIVADESRTFGMEGLFRQIGIYSAYGQQYQPEDRKQLMYYREDFDGQLLQEGLNEAGALSSWIAAATSYSVHQLPMIPFYIYYSMFGYQRCGDLIWSAGDARARGFLLGATSGRTTLAGEGLQHQDGQNILMFGMVPNCVAYDPTFSYELAVIMQNGLKRMYENGEDVFYYITLINENYHHPAMPEGVESDILKGMYLFEEASDASAHCVQLLGSGAILREVIKAAEILKTNFGVAADIWSVPSFTELHRDIDSVTRYNRLHPNAEPKQSHVTQCLENRPGRVVAATDYIKLYAEQIRAAISQPYTVLGTDGFGRSDTREALRDFFEVDANMIAYTVLRGLYDDQAISLDQLLDASKKLGIDSDRPDPITV